jgi:spore germination protein GerM
VAAQAAQVYFPRWFDDDSLGLQAIERQLPTGENVARAALEALIQGPTGPERANNVQYALDRRTRILGFSLDGGTASIELDPEGLDRVHGRPFSELAFWSVVFTVTEAPGVERVVLVRGGAPLAVLGDPPFTLPMVASRSAAPQWVQPRPS